MITENPWPLCHSVVLQRRSKSGRHIDKAEVRHRFSCSVVDEVLVVDLLGRVSSNSSFLLITCRASKTCMFVNNDFTSKLTMMVLSGPIYRLLTFSTKCGEFMTKGGGFVVSGAMT